MPLQPTDRASKDQSPGFGPHTTSALGPLECGCLNWPLSGEEVTTRSPSGAPITHPPERFGIEAGVVVTRRPFGLSSQVALPLWDVGSTV